MDEREVNEFLYKGADDLWAYDLWEKHENLHWLPREGLNPRFDGAFLN